MENQSLPCPFCGKSNQDRYPCEWLDGSGANVIRCAWCHGAAPMNVWNRRTAHPSAPAGVEDIAGRLRNLAAIMRGDGGTERIDGRAWEHVEELAAFLGALAQKPAEAFDPSIHPIPGEGQQPAAAQPGGSDNDQ